MVVETHMYKTYICPKQTPLKTLKWTLQLVLRVSPYRKFHCIDRHVHCLSQLHVGVMHLCADKFFISPLENHSVNLIMFFNNAQSPKFKAKLTKIIMFQAESRKVDGIHQSQHSDMTF